LIIQKILNQCISDKSSGKVLEVGCGSGGNLDMLKQYGEIAAMELDDEARKLANSRNICSVKSGMLPNKIPFDDKFDLICMLDVLEHIDDDLAALQSVKAKLSGSGKLLITVPAYNFLWSTHDVTHHHKRQYTKKDLSITLSELGLDVTYSTYFNTFLFPVIALIRFIKNILGNKGGSDENLPSNMINSILKKIFSSERAFLPNFFFPFGVSILLIAEVSEIDKG
jgi:SAM-dependent methyltransferase